MDSPKSLLMPVALCLPPMFAMKELPMEHLGRLSTVDILINMSHFVKKYYQYKKNLGPYSQHFVFFVTYESAQYTTVFHKTRLLRLSSNKHTNLLGLFVSYDGNEVL